MKKQTIAELSLLIITFFWGASYYFSDMGLTHLGPFTLNAYRFILAFIIAFTVGFKWLRDVSKDTLKYSLLIGVTLFIVYIGATFGLKYTTLSNAGFLCSFTVILTPIFEVIFLKKKLSSKIVISATLSIIGIVLLTLKEDFSLNMDHLPGDLLCLLCATFYAVDILLTEKAVANENVKPFQLGVYQLIIVGFLNLAAGFIFEEPTLEGGELALWPIVFLAVFCTSATFIGQTIAQQYTKASRVSIIYTLEPVFAAVVAYFFAGEVLGTKGYIGATIMILSLILMETDFKFLETKKTGEEN